MADNTRPESPTARGLDARALDYSASIAFDRRLYRHDIAASIAHARMLARQGIIPAGDAELIARGLEEVRGEIERGGVPFRQGGVMGDPPPPLISTRREGSRA